MMPLRVFAQAEALPPDHWAYEELEHFESRGFIVLHGLRPYARADVQRWVESLQAAREAGKLTSVEQGRLARLEDEFIHGAPIAEAERRFDPPMMRLYDEDWGMTLDAEASTGGASRFGSADGPEANGTAWGRARLEALVRFREWAAYETRYDVLLAEEGGNRTDKNFVTSRERNWKGLTSQDERAYLALQGHHARLVLGREYSAWGSQPGQELLVSAAGRSMDMIQVQLQLKRLRLASSAGWLSVALQRNYAAHRLELDLGQVQLGFHEAVVYVSPHLEPTYLFPLSFYYGNQFNERHDDNSLMGFDAKWASPLGLFGAELLVDDFIYDGDPAPNRLGFQGSWRRGIALGGTDLDVQLGYVAIQRWVYTHRDSLNSFVAASGDPHLDPFLGNPLGPDADRWSLQLHYTPDPRLALRLELSHTRRGEGNRDLTPWNPGDPYDLGFPSGPVWTDNRLALGARVYIGRRVLLSGAAEVAHGTNGGDGRLAAEIRIDP